MSVRLPGVSPAILTSLYVKEVALLASPLLQPLASTIVEVTVPALAVLRRVDDRPGTARLPSRILDHSATTASLTAPALPSTNDVAGRMGWS